MSKIWYKEPGVWLLITPLIFIVFVCAILVTVAISGSDDRITDDYYKEGKMINNRFAAESLAQDYHIKADVIIDTQGLSIETHIHGNAPEVEAVYIEFSHPAEADLDHGIRLTRLSDGKYRGQLDHQLEGRWYIRLEPETNDTSIKWRLVGENDFRVRNQFRLE